MIQDLGLKRGSYADDEADTLGGGAASADEAHGDHQTSDREDDHGEPTQEQQRRGDGVVEQEDSVEQRVVADVHPQTDTDQRQPTQLYTATHTAAQIADVDPSRF